MQVMKKNVNSRIHVYYLKEGWRKKKKTVCIINSYLAKKKTKPHTPVSLSLSHLVFLCIGSLWANVLVYIFMYIICGEKKRAPSPHTHTYKNRGFLSVITRNGTEKKKNWRCEEVFEAGAESVLFCARVLLVFFCFFSIHIGLFFNSVPLG